MDVDDLKAYTSASDESADMKLAAESLEAIKTSIHVDNIFEILINFRSADCESKWNRTSICDFEA